MRSDASARFRVVQLNPRRATPFSVAPDADARAALAADLGLLSLPAYRFEGEIAPAAGQAWELRGTMRATVVQECVVTLDPVTTHLREEVRRVYSPHLDTPEAEEVEMGDENTDPLGQVIDAAEVGVESLTLALPLYPRKEGAGFDPAPAADVEDAPTRKPFAGLAALLQNRD